MLLMQQKYISVYTFSGIKIAHFFIFVIKSKSDPKLENSIFVNIISSFSQHNARSLKFRSLGKQYSISFQARILFVCVQILSLPFSYLCAFLCLSSPAYEMGLMPLLTVWLWGLNICMGSICQFVICQFVSQYVTNKKPISQVVWSFIIQQFGYFSTNFNA